MWSVLRAGSYSSRALAQEVGRCQALVPREALTGWAVAERGFCKAVNSSGGSMTSTGMYNWRVAAVHNALAKRGKEKGALTVSDLVSLGHLDQYHYMGVEACDEVIEILGLDSSSKVLDIGSGIGGPARYLSMKSGCEVTGVELQADLTAAAAELTARVGLENKVRYVTGDFVTAYNARQEWLHGVKYDHFISLLVFLHIPDRRSTLATCYEALSPGGTFLIEDFALLTDGFTKKEEHNLKSVVSAHSVTSKADYIAELESIGFVDIQVVDLTQPWTAWTKARHESYRDSRAQTVKDHGEKIFNDRVSFYEVIDSLFAAGNLGGVRITGRRPGRNEQKLHNGRRLSAALRKSKAVLNEYGSTVEQ